METLTIDKSRLKYYALIPIRHHSQRITGKNYRLLGEYPLYYHIVNTLCMIDKLYKVIINTDSNIIKDGLNKYFNKYIENKKLIIYDRDKSLCDDNISMNIIINNSILQLCKDGLIDITDPHNIILQTHVTNPFLSKETIYTAFNIYEKYDVDSVFTVNMYKFRFWTDDGIPVNHKPNELIQTQDLTPLFSENSLVYLFGVVMFMKNNNRIGDKSSYIISPPIENIDIDIESDFMMADMIYKNKQIKEISISNNKVLDDEEIYKSLINMTKNEGYDKINFNNNCVLISAPYMMSNIDCFLKYFKSLNIDCIVAKVEERLNEKELMNYNGKYNVAITGDDAFTDNIISMSVNEKNDYKLKGICKWGTGIDSISKEACIKYGVKLLNTPNAFTEPVCESIMSAILSFSRNIHKSTMLMNYSDKWIKIPSKTLREMTIGIIGYGNIGVRLGELLSVFKANVIAYDIIDKVEKNDVKLLKGENALNKLFNESDIICLCCDYNSSSKYIINKETIQHMKNGVYIINMARGMLIKNDDLIDALRNGKISGAALDVFENEPLPYNNELRRMPNILLSSHNANSSPSAWMNIHINTIKNCLNVLTDRQ